jgi:hypothetical protein
MKKMKVVKSRKRFNGEDGQSLVDRSDDTAKDEGLESALKGTRASTFKEAFREARDKGKNRFYFNGKSYTTELAGSKPAESKPAESKPAEPKPAAKSETTSDEVPSVAKIEKEREGTSEGTSTSEKLKSGLSDTAEKVLGAVGATAGAAALGRQAYKMAKAPLGFMGEAKRMVSNVGQNLRNKVSGRTASAAGEGAEAAAQATKSVGPSQFEKAKTAAQRARNAKLNKRDVKQPKPTDDEKDMMRMGSDYMKRGGKVHKYAKGGSIGSASRRGDGIAMRGKTRGKMF